MGDLQGVLEILRDERDPERIARHQDDGAHLAGRDPDVELAAADADAALVDDAHGWDSNWWSLGVAGRRTRDRVA